MTNVVRRFIKEAICREKLNTYGVIYRLSNGNYYKLITDAYDAKEARRRFKKNLSDSPLHEFKPTEGMKELVEIHEYLYVFYMGKAE